MNPLLQCKPAILPLFIAGVLACFGFVPKTQAVVPPPDGGYPGGNTAEGANALLSVTTGQYNTAVGLNSLSSTTTGTFNTAIGSAALRFNTTSDSNTAVGESAMYYNTTGVENTAVGESALIRNTQGSSNTVIGSFALPYNTTGDNNTAIGWEALINNTAGSDNTSIGLRAGSNVVTAVNVICIGAPGANVSDSCYIGNVWQQPGGSQAAYVNALGKLGAQVSSRRFKDEIKAMAETSEVIYLLKPVSFRYKPEIEPTRPPGFGLIAEDVEKINPDLVVRDKQGKPYSVRYDQVNAMLLNEFLKEHRTVQEQKATIAQLKKDFRATVAQLTTRLDEQAAQIQKVSTQLEASKPAPQVVKSND